MDQLIESDTQSEVYKAIGQNKNTVIIKWSKK